ncbi:MAG: hypothetical protein RIS88_264, partial [Pseudomonadota bacterium]
MFLAPPTTNQALQTALDNAAEILRQLPTRDDFRQIIEQAFGKNILDASAWESAFQSLQIKLQGDGLQLRVELLSGEIMGSAQAAFAAAGPEGDSVVYLNSAWLDSGASVDDVTVALLEEAGHRMDVLLNGDRDSAGDEGNEFASYLTVTGSPLLFDADADDHAQLFFNGVPVDVECATLGGTSTSPTYTEQAEPIIINSRAFAIGPTGTTITKAEVAITNFQTGDLLSFSAVTSGGGQTGASFSAAYSSGLLTLTSSGGPTLANWENALNNVYFSSTADDPTGSNSIRNITFKVYDATVSAVVNSTVTITPVNDAPVVTAAASAAYTENASSATVLSSGLTLTLTDADDTNIASGSVTIGNFTAGDTLTWTNQDGITATYNTGTGVLTLSGSAARATYQTLLSTVAYSSTSDDPTVNGTKTTRTITWSVTDANSDGAGAATSTAATTTLTIAPVNDAPVVTSAASATYTENAASATVLSPLLTLSDADDTNIASGSVTIGNFTAGDTLTWTNKPGINAAYNSDTGVLTLSGSAALANYQALLRTVAYSNASNDPTLNSATRTITWSVTDANSDGAGPATSTAATTTLTIAPVNDAPVVTTAASAAYTENGASATVLSSGLTLSDADDTNIASGSVTIGNFTAGDTLTWT